MSIEALWSVTFASNANRAGGGVVVIETGKILGGDAMFTYVGNIRVTPDGETAIADVHCRQYRDDIPGHASIFGPIKEFNLKLEGPYSEQRMLLDGHLVEDPRLKIRIELIRQAELP